MSDSPIKPKIITALQTELTVRWHNEPCESKATDPFMALVEENHKRNFTLWHHEDDARREDMGFEFVYQAKRAIDRNNQQRNDFIEQIDKHLFTVFGENFPDSLPMNTESPGMIIDRLSILALKEFHMREEVERLDATEEHKSKCRFKLGVIQKQMDDLRTGLEQLLEDCETGARGFRVYFQFKMYNDPELNPALYKKPVPGQEI